METINKWIFHKHDAEEEEVTTSPPKQAEETTPKEEQAPPKEEEKQEEAPEVEQETNVEDTTPAAEDDEEEIQPTLLTEARNVLTAWKDVYDVEKEGADVMYYYAEELWCEDKKAWAAGKRKVLRKEWTIEHFDKEMKDLEQKQEPVWAKLLGECKDIREKVDTPHKNVVATHKLIQKKLGRTNPMKKLLGKKSSAPELRKEYHYKLKAQFQEAETQYQLLCAWPEGKLTTVKLMYKNSLKETTQLVDHVHNLDKKKHLTHDDEEPKEEEQGEAKKEEAPSADADAKKEEPEEVKPPVTTE